MRLHYLDVALRRLVSEADFHPAGWSVGDIRALRELAQCLYAAEVVADVLALRSLDLQPYSAGGSGAWFVGLADERQVLVTFKTDGGESAAEVQLHTDGTDDMA